MGATGLPVYTSPDASLALSQCGLRVKPTRPAQSSSRRASCAEAPLKLVPHADGGRRWQRRCRPSSDPHHDDRVDDDEAAGARQRTRVREPHVVGIDAQASIEAVVADAQIALYEQATNQDQRWDIAKRLPPGQTPTSAEGSWSRTAMVAFRAVGGPHCAACGLPPQSPQTFLGPHCQCRWPVAAVLAAQRPAAGGSGSPRHPSRTTAERSRPCRHSRLGAA